MVISVADYNGRFVKTKTVEIEEGVEFEIRRLSPVDMWDTDIKSLSSIEFIKKVATKGSINPPVFDGKKEGCLDIRDIAFDHINKLVNEILIFSGYVSKDGGKNDFLSQEKKDKI